MNVHEGPHGFGIDVALKPGHIITNEPGFYKEGSFGVRIESALVVKRVEVRNGRRYYTQEADLGISLRRSTSLAATSGLGLSV